MPYEKQIKRGRRRPIFTPGDGATRLSMGREEIKQMVPHREPFLLIDGIEAFDQEEQAVLGHRTIDPEDPVLAGHFPGDPVYPGVLLLESMAQLCISLQSLLAPDGENVQAGVRLLKVHHALFQDAALPGDRLAVAAKMIEDNGYTATMVGQVLRGDTILTVAVLEAYLIDA